MNMHLHSHLISSILDYGPVYAYWLFSFERFNGMLGNIPTNNRSIEVQLMKRFISDQLLQSDRVTIMLKECNMHDILSSHKKVKGSVAKQLSTNEEPHCKYLGPIHFESFDKEECESLTSLFFQSEYSDCSIKCFRLH